MVAMNEIANADEDAQIEIEKLPPAQNGWTAEAQGDWGVQYWRMAETHDRRGTCKICGGNNERDDLPECNHEEPQHVESITVDVNYPTVAYVEEMEFDVTTLRADDMDGLADEITDWMSGHPSA